MNLHLVSSNFELVECWQYSFRAFPEVSVHHGDILELAENAIVSPANSRGLMDGGIDELYVEFFGMNLQETVLKAYDHYAKLAKSPIDELLPVGNALLVPTGHSRIPYLISAPTMKAPMPVPPSNCFFAMAALLDTCRDHQNLVKNVWCPGLTTGVGRVPYGLAAQEMANAYRKLPLKRRKRSHLLLQTDEWILGETR